ncbi:protein mono-ADP-ribosyltransferase PARP9 [Brachyistius frenatus]|uniref:protein mono-ADP-ribosyltransferase PARP9 n=1 Tax=Brachyistius frenatus TaxID=100188 RepID=UPI0037E6FEBC
MASKHDIPLTGSSVNIVKKCGPALNDILNSKFGCGATFSGVDFERDLSIAHQKSSYVGPDRRFGVTLHSGVEVSVWKADLTNLSVDAVVNAANTDLQHVGGLAWALSKAGGPQIQRDSDDHIRKNGPLLTGEAIISAPGKLPCKNIIHAVGPQLTDPSYISSAEPFLEKAINSILDRVKTNKLNTVAIPAISSGLFNYPLPQCANTIVKTVKRYYEGVFFNIGHIPKEILLVNHDDLTVQEMERACREILAPHLAVPNSQTTARKTRSAAKTSTPTVQIANVCLTLMKGRIEDQPTDVIVNTASPDLKLSTGEISKALLQKAGPEIQNAIKNTPPKGYVIRTPSYKLPCKEVYHTRCTDRGAHGAEKVLWKSVSDCLWLTAASFYKSIAFPAIGTGNLKFTRKESARILLDAVNQFAQNSTQKMNVYFVIFPSDHGTFQAFEEQMKWLQAPRGPTPEASEKRDPFPNTRTPPPQISLTGPSIESLFEADKWLGHLFKSSGTIEIYNNFIQHFSHNDYVQLSRLQQNGVSVEEFFTAGHACITLNGPSDEVAVAALQVEAMLCSVQKDFVAEEEGEMLLLSSAGNNVPFERKRVDRSTQEFKDKAAAFHKQGLRISKLDKVENSTLQLLFNLKKNQLQCHATEEMFQRVPAQFCEMVSHVGFHAEFAPPEDPAYGEGIYFASTAKKAMEVWKGKREEYLYFVEAEVLTGSSVPGRRGLFLPPALGTEPLRVHDSVSGGSDISVIFSGYQALPKYIITCQK